jgi:hypothetical protein
MTERKISRVTANRWEMPVKTPRPSNTPRVLLGKSTSKMASKSTLRDRALRSTVLEFGPEAFIDTNQDEIEEVEIDLEDVLQEEDIIFNIYQAVKDKTKVSKHIRTWWDESSKQFPRQVQLFEGDAVKKLIRQYQIMFILTLGYLELHKKSESMKLKAYTCIKNILTNVHRNYLVFLEFLYKNLSEDQRERTRRVTEKMLTVLNDRPTNKLQYKCSPSQILKSNNDIAMTMLKTLIKNYSLPNDFNKGALEIIKNIDVLSVAWVRDI